MPRKIRPMRAYDTIPHDNGHYRVLVDRIWPRGVSKEALELDEWLKVLAPSTELRKWFDHDPERWDEFRQRYFDELKDAQDHVSQMIEDAGKRTILLLYGAKDEDHNQAVALKEWIENHDAKWDS
ncbi:DUF488 domain-containing protein [Allorhodopirellula solitaria]|uniref:Uroporphyrin-III C-methyltransferase n=1 Tax=Allorhodopirellula solitaria TaxID=2527987 RepID=A0A5C5XX42_9BACT|nr:DUF488 family protein [Allorhodopirellula solitaria]TWT67081.1 hypothetical protein CA85_19270 [Allorhodopirellula solitaria]